VRVTFPLWGFLANTDISYDPQHIDAQTCMAWMDNYRAGLSHQQQLRMFNQLESCSAGSHGKGLRQKGSLLPSTPTSSP
jgi:alpha-glucosidase